MSENPIDDPPSPDPDPPTPPSEEPSPPEGFSFPEICAALGMNPETTKALIITPHGHYAAAAAYPEPTTPGAPDA